MLAVLGRNKLVLLFIALIAAYLALTLTATPNPEALARYDLTAGEAKALTLTIAAPLILIWLTSMFGYLYLRSYVNLIKKSRDGSAFRTISFGILGLSLWLPLSSVVSALTVRYYQANPEATASMVRLDNYINLLILFPAFVLIYAGSKRLLPLIKKSTFSPPLILIVSFIAAAAAYTYMVFNDTARNVALTPEGVAAYYLPEVLLLFTIVIPRIIMWFLGLMAVYNIYLYSKNVKGSLYRSALLSLALGIGGVVSVTILLRVLQSLSSVVSSASLAAILLIIYGMLIIISVGFVFIAKGAKKLRKLEDF